MAPFVRHCCAWLSCVEATALGVDDAVAVTEALERRSQEPAILRLPADGRLAVRQKHADLGGRTRPSWCSHSSPRRLQRRSPRRREAPTRYGETSSLSLPPCGYFGAQLLLANCSSGAIGLGPPLERLAEYRSAGLDGHRPERGKPDRAQPLGVADHERERAEHLGAIAQHSWLDFDAAHPPGSA